MTQIKDRLAYAIETAASVHRGQKDKGGISYILHPLAVMQMVEIGGRWLTSEQDQEDLMIVAVLHDAIEDFEGGPGEKSEFREHLRSVFGQRVYDALDLLTRPNGMSYEDYIERLSKGTLARRVKIADLTHNMDTGRLPEGDIGDKDFQRWDKYRRALVRLKKED